jgi:hypothetical protein
MNQDFDINSSSNASKHPFFEVPRFGQVLVVICAGGFLVLCSIYVSQFGFSFSDSRDHWGQFGDFIGGVLNPIIATGALVGVWYSVGLQQRELKATREELLKSRLAVQKQLDENFLFSIINQIRVLEVNFELVAPEFTNEANRSGQSAIRELVSNIPPDRDDEYHWGFFIANHETNGSLNALGNAWQALIKTIDTRWPDQNEGDAYFELSLSLLTSGSFDLIMYWAMHTPGAGSAYLGQRYLGYIDRRGK